MTQIVLINAYLSFALSKINLRSITEAAIKVNASAATNENQSPRIPKSQEKRAASGRTSRKARSEEMRKPRFGISAALQKAAATTLRPPKKKPAK